MGDLFKIGDSVLLEVMQIGKECHTSCAIKNNRRLHHAARRAVCYNRGSGHVQPGDMVDYLPQKNLVEAAG